MVAVFGSANPLVHVPGQVHVSVPVHERATRDVADNYGLFGAGPFPVHAFQPGIRRKGTGNATCRKRFPI